ncbi:MULTISPECIES: NAD(P)/FAD-dependent oxidoreductase [Amycolatopsis]|uniref:Glycine/D-amino acid oxidase-like deaminating enzyme n=1 Tax=Amycolatopsis echigonensis TaxID=2576905 RepID=A0A2N3WNR3_9PSEU|nr:MULTISPECIES: FAD-dependent oxidoreductase [Amycolatopsis]PKV95505.1 glycine/D-amino acid oxidase-like deaminating enzyme [Amycolatopsis niigatensis]
MDDNGRAGAGLSFWHDDAGGDGSAKETLDHDLDVDVAIVGGGYTGLWTAYYLAKADPSLRVAVLESEFVGFGASGRNGGWCSAIFPATMRKVASISSRTAAVRMQRAMNDTVWEIRDVVEAESIDCDFRAGGYLSVARNAAQWTRARNEVAGWREWGFGADHMRLIEPRELVDQIRMADARGATFTPHCAALQPAKLVRGLADAARAAGVQIYEGTRVVGVESRRLETERARVTAEVVVRATEGYTARLAGARRDILPMYSLMVATAPLPAAVWEEIGLQDRPTFSDKRHLRIYGQRTADGRIAFGGRGAPYHFASRVAPRFDNDPSVHAMLRSILGELFPPLRGIEFTHAWGGNLGIARDWLPSVSYDRRAGFAQAGGYVGDGVATANLAGRTLAAEILDLDSEIRSLPWVGHQSPKWEPEPLRWLGVNAGTVAFGTADRLERRSGQPSRLASGLWRALGH